MIRDWSNITLRDWYQIQDIISVQDEWTMYNLLDYLYNIDSSNMPISEVKNYSLAFMHDLDALNNVKVDKELDTRYDVDLDITKLSVAQFIDYQNYSKEYNPKLEKLISVFVWPKGHTYNDGYDIKQVQEDILNWPFAVVKKVGFFLAKQLETFINLTLYYLKADLKKMGLKNQKEIDKLIEQTSSLLSELSPTS